MNKKDFAVGIIANNIGTEGTLLEFQAGYGQTMAEVPFHLTLTPPTQITTLGNSEKVLVTAKVDDEKFTIVRAQGDTIARDIKAGWIAGNGIYVEDLPSTPADVQLDNVDNTSDLDKPISTATQTALDGKVSVVAGKGLSANDYTDVDKAKLDTIEENATANSSDEQLRDRAQHTGVQPIQTVDGLEQALGDKQPAGDYATGAQGALADTSLQPGGVAAVALSGSYADLTEKPNIPSVSGFATTTYVNEVANLKLNLTDVVNNLTSTATDKPLSAEQGRQLKVFIDTINTAISSDDTSLDQLQEIVDFIKLNRDELDNLTISGVAGLQAALDGKQPLGNYATAVQGAKADTAVQPTEITDFETSTELDARDTANRLRSNHSGTQAISTVAGLQDELDTKANASDLTAHASNTSNPHSVTKAQVGLSNVDNTSDVNKPVSTAQAAADATRVSKSGDTMTGRLTVDNPSGADNYTDLFYSGTSNYAILRYGNLRPAANNTTATLANVARNSDGGISTFGSIQFIASDVSVANKQSHINFNRMRNNVSETALSLGNTQATLNYTDIAFGGGVKLIYGTGFPNGVVTAPVGSIYIDTAVTNGASSWIKKSGVGNTGWQVLDGDTGWRNISSLLDPGVLSSGALNIRMVGSQIFVQSMNSTIASGGGSTRILTNIGSVLGEPYRPNENVTDVVTVHVSTAAITRHMTYQPAPSGGFVYYGSADNGYWASSYNGRGGWPTTLPGTAV